MGTATCLINATLNKVIVSALQFDGVGIVLASAAIYIGIIGVLLFLLFVMGFQRSSAMYMQNLNAWADVVKMESMEKYRPSEQDEEAYLFAGCACER